MTNLFSVFDPQIFNFPLNWSASMVALILLPPIYWMTSNQVLVFVKMTMFSFHKQLKLIFGWHPHPGSTVFPSVIFVMIFLNNTQGLLPYVFTSSSHLPFAVTLALPLWLGHMVYSLSHQPTFMLAHLVPMSTPMVLMPFMVLIELISSLIRPLTLSVRLVANIMAGHLLLVLISSSAMAAPVTILFLVMLGLIALSILEMAVSLIQAYVFSLLSILYLGEINTKNLALQ